MQDNLATAASKLQWGRNLIVAEGRQHWAHVQHRGTASMGPQLDSCGRPRGHVAYPKQDLLQWGRNLIVAEGTWTVSG